MEYGTEWTLLHHVDAGKGEVSGGFQMVLVNIPGTITSVYSLHRSHDLLPVEGTILEEDKSSSASSRDQFAAAVVSCLVIIIGEEHTPA